MGSIDDKLNELKSTKQSIKEAIVNKGVEVSDSTPFYQYPDKIIAIPSSGGTTKKYKMGTFTSGSMELSTVLVGDKLGLNKTFHSYNTSVGGYPFQSMSGILPYEYYSDDTVSNYYKNILYSYSGTKLYKYSDVKIRQVFRVDENFAIPSNRVVSNGYYVMFTSAGSSVTMSSSNYTYGITLNYTAAGSDYYADLYVGYMGGGTWLDIGVVPVNVGDIVDLTFEFTDANTFKITRIINSGTPDVFTTTTTDYAFIYNLGNSYVNLLGFGGTTSTASSGKYGVRCTLLEGTSVYNQNTGEPIWQLFEEVE